MTLESCDPFLPQSHTLLRGSQHPSHNGWQMERNRSNTKLLSIAHEDLLIFTLDHNVWQCTQPWGSPQKQLGLSPHTANMTRSFRFFLTLERGSGQIYPQTPLSCLFSPLSSQDQNTRTSFGWSHPPLATNPECSRMTCFQPHLVLTHNPTATLPSLACCRCHHQVFITPSSSAYSLWASSMARRDPLSLTIQEPQRSWSLLRWWNELPVPVQTAESSSSGCLQTKIKDLHRHQAVKWELIYTSFDMCGILRPLNYWHSTKIRSRERWGYTKMCVHQCTRSLASYITKTNFSSAS